MMLTPADLLAKGLGLGPLAMAPQPVPPGTCCAITGQPIDEGYRVADLVGESTAEFLDCFRCGIHGWVSVAAGRCFKNADPRKGNPLARPVMVFEDGTYYNPLISVTSAVAQGRPCWSRLVRDVWPERRGQPVVIILTTDMKKRLWINARVGALGRSTPVLLYDNGYCLNAVRYLSWPKLIKCLDFIEYVHTLGFPKPAIQHSLYMATKKVDEIGFGEARSLNNTLVSWRKCPEFLPALLIAQKREEETQ